MDGPRDYHTKQSNSERERQISYDIMYVESIKYNTMKQKQTHKQREQRLVVARG